MHSGGYVQKNVSLFFSLSLSLSPYISISWLTAYHDKNYLEFVCLFGRIWRTLHCVREDVSFSFSASEKTSLSSSLSLFLSRHTYTYSREYAYITEYVYITADCVLRQTLSGICMSLFIERDRLVGSLKAYYRSLCRI